jgi:hypothetical protein
MANKSDSVVERRRLFSMKRRAQKAQGKGAGNGSDYRQRIRANKVARGSKKNGCLPKLFMLALPFFAVGSFLLLGL